MSDIDLVVKKSKQFEGILEQQFGAQGRGLHEKVSSVERQLPAATVRKLRKIATVRNKVVHQTDANRIDNRQDFLTACTEAERELKALARKRPGPPAGVNWRTVLLAGMVIFLLLFLVYQCSSL